MIFLILANTGLETTRYFSRWRIASEIVNPMYISRWAVDEKFISTSILQFRSDR
jgi:hypothetical protein